MVNQDPQPEIFETVHEFDYTGGDIAANTMRAVDVFTYQANNEEFRLYAVRVELECLFKTYGIITTMDVVTDPGGAALVDGVYTPVAVSSVDTLGTPGDGSGAVFTITVAGGVASITAVVDGGTGYNLADTLSFDRSQFTGGVAGPALTSTPTAITDGVSDYTECGCCTVIPAGRTGNKNISLSKYSPDNTGAPSFGGMDFNIGIRVGGQLVPSTTFDASSIYCTDTRTLAFACPVIVLFKQPFQIEVSNATTLATLATFGKRRVRVILIGELGIQKQY